MGGKPVVVVALLLDAERVAHVEKDVVEDGEGGRRLVGEIDLDAGARLQAGLQAALQRADGEPGDGNDERRRLVGDAERVQEAKSVGHVEPRRDARIDADGRRGARSVEIGANPRGHGDARILEHHVRPRSECDVIARGEHRVELLRLRVVGIGIRLGIGAVRLEEDVGAAAQLACRSHGVRRFDARLDLGVARRARLAGNLGAIETDGDGRAQFG